MAFALPTFAETRDFMRAVGRAIFPWANYGNVRSYHSRRAAFVSAAVTEILAGLRQLGFDLMPDTAGDDGPIDRWGAIVGVTRKGATGARKSQALRVHGTIGSAVPLGQQLKHDSSGLIFQIATATTVSALGYVDADISAVSLGSATRLSKTEVLKWLITPPGLEGTGVLQLDLDQDGFDAEQFGSYRARVLDVLGNPSSGGNQDDYVRWMLEVDGVSSAYCYPNRAGLGTIDLVALHTGSGAARTLNGGEVALLLAYVAARAPASVAATFGALRHLNVVIDTQNVELIISPNGLPAYAFDWTGGPLTVSTWTPGTRALQFTGALPSSMKAGHRFSVRGVGSSQDSRELTIEAIAASDTIIVQTPPPNAFVATDQAYSGGPLVTPIRSAIIGHMNGETVYAGKNGLPQAASSVASTVGLSVIADGIGPANPAGKYGTWNGALLLVVLGQIATSARGVRNLTIVSPALDYEAVDDAFPNDANIHLIAPGAVLVRSST